MHKYKLAMIRHVNKMWSKADFTGYYQALKPYLISIDPYIVEGDIDVLVKIGREHQVETNWVVVSESTK